MKKSLFVIFFLSCMVFLCNAEIKFALYDENLTVNFSMESSKNEGNYVSPYDFAIGTNVVKEKNLIVNYNESLRFPFTFIKDTDFMRMENIKKVELENGTGYIHVDSKIWNKIEKNTDSMSVLPLVVFLDDEIIYQTRFFCHVKDVLQFAYLEEDEKTLKLLFQSKMK